MVTPLIWTVAGPSGATNVIVPLVASTGKAGLDPGGSVPRGGRPTSDTMVPSPTVGTKVITAGLSAMLIVSVAVEVSPSPSVS